MITPNDDTRFPACRGLYIGVTGDITVVWANETTCLFTNVPAGAILPLSVIGVMDTGTDAEEIVGLS